MSMVVLYVFKMKSGYVYVSGALSFGTAVMPWSLDLIMVIKVMINKVNSVACGVGVPQLWYQSWGYEFLPTSYKVLAQVVGFWLRSRVFSQGLWVPSPDYEFSNGTMEYGVKDKWMERLISVSYSYHNKRLRS